MDEMAAREMVRELKQRGISKETMIILLVRTHPNFSPMVDWLKANPTATLTQIRDMATDLGVSDPEIGEE